MIAFHWHLQKRHFCLFSQFKTINFHWDPIKSLFWTHLSNDSIVASGIIGIFWSVDSMRHGETCMIILIFYTFPQLNLIGHLISTKVLFTVRFVWSLTCIHNNNFFKCYTLQDISLISDWFWVIQVSFKFINAQYFLTRYFWKSNRWNFSLFASINW